MIIQGDSGERSIFWEVAVSVIVIKKKDHMNMGLVVNGYRERAVGIYKYKRTKAL
jgi:hypothetical protein